MSGFWRCALYVAALGVVFFPIGRLAARHRFKWDRFPWKDYPFERQGALYRKIAIHKWQAHVPDMSRVFKKLMPAKRLYPGISAAEVDEMVQETCVAEWTHIALSFAALPCFWLWPGWGGALFYIVYTLLGNVTFILIQRFNRPKLAALAQKLRRKEARS